MENNANNNLMRYHYLDGVRGIAAAMVVMCHFILMFFSDFETQSINRIASITHSFSAASIIQAYINMFNNGSLAVFIFWFMSGYVISINLFKSTGNNYLLSAFTKRYFRLAIPATCSAVIAYTILKSGAMHNSGFNVKNHNSNWIHLFYQFEPNFLQCIKNGVWDTFFDYHEKDSYNASLWTMDQELYGSLLSFFLFGVFRTNSKRYWVYAVIIGTHFFLNHFSLITFLCGFILCDLDHSQKTKHPVLIFLEGKIFSKWYLSMIILLMLLFFAGKKTHVDIRDMCSSCLIVFTISRSLSLSSFFNFSFFRWLGKISFSIYLLHLPILCSLTCYLYNKLQFSHLANAIISSSISFGVILICAQAFTYLVDVPAIKFSNRIGKFFIKSDT